MWCRIEAHHTIRADARRGATTTLYSGWLSGLARVDFNPATRSSNAFGCAESGPRGNFPQKGRLGESKQPAPSFSSFGDFFYCLVGSLHRHPHGFSPTRRHGESSRGALAGRGAAHKRGSDTNPFHPFAPCPVGILCRRVWCLACTRGSLFLPQQPAQGQRVFMSLPGLPSATAVK